MTANSTYLLRVPAARACLLIETLRDQGIETQAELPPAKLQIKARDFERVRTTLENAGIGFVVEARPRS